MKTINFITFKAKRSVVPEKYMPFKSELRIFIPCGDDGYLPLPLRSSTVYLFGAQLKYHWGDRYSDCKYRTNRTFLYASSLQEIEEKEHSAMHNAAYKIQSLLNDYKNMEIPEYEKEREFIYPL